MLNHSDSTELGNRIGGNSQQHSQQPQQNKTSITCGIPKRSCGNFDGTYDWIVQQRLYFAMHD